MLILAVVAVMATIFGLWDGIVGLQAGNGIAFFAAMLILPILLWIVTVYFYGKYRKEKASST